MDDFVARQLLQAVSRTATNATGLEVNSPNARQYTNSRGFEFGMSYTSILRAVQWRRAPVHQRIGCHFANAVFV